MRKWLALSGAIVSLDQASKVVAMNWLADGMPVTLLPGVNFVLVHNAGAAFSLLSEAGGWQRWLLLGIALVVSGFLYAWLVRLERSETGSAVAIAAIIGGALGNAIDRLVHGYVVDFIDLYYGEYHWPVFNVADAAITVGAAALIIIAAKSG